MKNLTPEHLRCYHGSCPSVHELDDGRLLIVGEVGYPEAYKKVPVGITETAIIIDRALLANVLALPPLLVGTLTAPPPYDPIDGNSREHRVMGDI